jgi:hypothetical protein
MQEKLEGTSQKAGRDEFTLNLPADDQEKKARGG